MRRLVAMLLLTMAWGGRPARAQDEPVRVKPLRLHTGAIDPVDLPPEDGEPGRIRVVQATGSARLVLQSLRDRGCEVLGYLPEDAYIVRLPGPEALGGLPGIRWRGSFRASWKRSSDLARLDPARPARLDVLAHPGRSLLDDRPDLVRAGRLLTLKDDFRGSGFARLAIAPGRLEAAVRTLTGIDDVAWVQPTPRPRLTNDDSAWMIQGGDLRETTTPLFDHGLTGEGEIIAIADSGLDTDACQFRLSADPGDQTLANSTVPPAHNVTNPANKVITYYLYSGSTPYDDRSRYGHGTYVSGCAAGDNYANPASGSDPGRDAHDGMAPAARIVFQDIGHRDGDQSGLPSPTTDMYLQAYDSGARIHNSSYGKTSPDVDYEGAARNVDEASWVFQDFLVVFSSGNEGPGPSTLAGMGSTAKNAVVVGASLPGADNWGYGVCSFSSQGPTSDGRLRPDLVAPGAVYSAVETDWIEQGGTDIYGQPMADSTTDPANNNCAVESSLRTGTSFSAPLVSGGALLTREYFTKGYHPTGTAAAADGFPPSAALIKAVLINSALSIGPSPNSMPGPLRNCETGSNIATLEAAPNHVEGWGVLRLDRTLYFPGDEDRLWVLTDTWNDGVDRGHARRPPIEEGRIDTFGLGGVRATKPLRVTLVWMDPAGSVGAGRVLVNDLDLEVQDESGNLYKGNVAFSSNRSQPAGAQGADTLNPVEQVIVQNGAEQDFVVRVIGRHLPGNGRTEPFPSTRQGYALIAVGDFDEVCLDGPCSGFPDAGQDGGQDAGVVDAGPADAGGDPGADAGGGDEPGADPGVDPADRGESGPGGRVEGGCGCGHGAPAGMAWAFLWLPAGLAGRRSRHEPS